MTSGLAFSGVPGSKRRHPREDEVVAEVKGASSNSVKAVVMSMGRWMALARPLLPRQGRGGCWGCFPNVDRGGSQGKFKWPGLCLWRSFHGFVRTLTLTLVLTLPLALKLTLTLSCTCCRCCCCWWWCRSSSVVVLVLALGFFVPSFQL